MGCFREDEEFIGSLRVGVVVPRGVEPDGCVGDGRLEGGVMVNYVGTGGGG